MSSSLLRTATTLGYQPFNSLTMKYKEFDLGQIEAVFNKLGGPHGVRRFLANKTIVQAVPQAFDVWRTIKVGNFKEQGLLIDEIFFSKKCEIQEDPTGKKDIVAVRDYCAKMVHADNFSMYSEEQDIDLVVLTPVDLGFKGGAKGKEIYSWAAQLGLHTCLSEVGPQLCFQPEEKAIFHKDLQVAMKALLLEGHDGFPYVFRINNRHESTVLDYASNDFISETTKLVFHLVKKQN